MLVQSCQAPMQQQVPFRGSAVPPAAQQSLLLQVHSCDLTLQQERLCIARHTGTNDWRRRWYRAASLPYSSSLIQCCALAAPHHSLLLLAHKCLQ